MGLNPLQGRMHSVAWLTLTRCFYRVNIGAIPLLCRYVSPPERAQ